MFEQERYALAVMCTSARFSELYTKLIWIQMMTLDFTHCGADIDCLDPVTTLFLLFVRNSICHDDLLQLATVQSFNGVSAKNAMSNDGNCIPGTMLNDNISCLYQGTASIRHVVNNDSGFVANISNEYHLRNLVRARTLLVNEGKTQIKAVCDGRCPRED
jgi:hypothetical protein